MKKNLNNKINKIINQINSNNKIDNNNNNNKKNNSPLFSTTEIFLEPIIIEEIIKDLNSIIHSKTKTNKDPFSIIEISSDKIIILKVNHHSNRNNKIKIIYSLPFLE